MFASTRLDNSNSDNSKPLLTRNGKLNFLSLEQNFTEIYSDNSSSQLTPTVSRFPSDFKLPGFYCTNKTVTEEAVS